MSLLATFDKIWENEDLSFADIESEIFLLDNHPLASTPSNSVTSFTDLSDEKSSEQMVTMRDFASPQAGSIEETNHETAAKKVSKKRKSRGEELPIPTTNVPPRKRAKTDAEKEQRRIERVLRNRAAAQSSRERKRKEVETLETERARLSESNSELKAQLLAQEAANHTLSRELESIKQTLKRYKEYLKVESRGSEPSTGEEENLFQFLLTDMAASASALDPSILEWRGASGQRESIIVPDYLE
ncbi:hypothetical protein HOY82DRAFT_537441 [Tuber indicum]|nr:hypothetical protein HOY82DRAFT_537441 [Tuber indicum]